MKKLFALTLAVCLSGCVGSPIASTLKYDSVQQTIKRNNDALLSIKVGMTKDEVLKVMGKPERSEGYQWGSVWLYRTAMTSGIYGTSDSDFTPVVFDESDKLAGWGRNFFTERVKNYEIEIKNR
jgi:hypothetical protein